MSEPIAYLRWYGMTNSYRELHLLLLQRAFCRLLSGLRATTLGLGSCAGIPRIELTYEQAQEQPPSQRLLSQR